MEENVNSQNERLPDCPQTDLQSDAGETTTDGGSAEKAEPAAYVQVKFNKEIKRLSPEQAAELAQKGMKFDMVSGEYEKLKELSKKEGMTVSGYLSHLETEAFKKRKDELLSECAGNEALAEHILSLEGAQGDGGFAELCAEFPEIADENAVPDEVKTAAQLKGTGLLFEYLLYEHRLRRAADEEKTRLEQTRRATTGSLSRSDGQSAADAEFLRGVWGR